MRFGSYSPTLVVSASRVAEPGPSKRPVDEYVWTPVWPLMFLKLPPAPPCASVRCGGTAGGRNTCFHLPLRRKAIEDHSLVIWVRTTGSQRPGLARPQPYSSAPAAFDCYGHDGGFNQSACLFLTHTREFCTHTPGNL